MGPPSSSPTPGNRRPEGRHTRDRVEILPRAPRHSQGPRNHKRRGAYYGHVHDQRVPDRPEVARGGGHTPTETPVYLALPDSYEPDPSRMLSHGRRTPSEGPASGTENPAGQQPRKHQTRAGRAKPERSEKRTFGVTNTPPTLDAGQYRDRT